MITKATLIARLVEDVPVDDGVPSQSQYEQAVNDAVVDFSNRAPMVRNGTLDIVAGTASYTLPADFIEFVIFPKITEYATQGSGVILTGDEIVPVSGTVQELFEIVGDQITFTPIPGYTLSRQYKYKAAYIRESEDDLIGLTEQHKVAVALLAQSYALGYQANRATLDAWQYSAGSERVSKERKSQAITERATALMMQYNARVDAIIGSRGMRSI